MKRNSYFGKYRGKVENNIDLMQMGRVQVSCPAVLGDGTLSWAMPSSPYAGDGVGLFAIPPNGANIWVEFEGGDPDYPIWSGCFWGLGEVPTLPALPQMKIFKTDTFCATISDLPGIGGLTIEISPPAVAIPIKIVCDTAGVEISTTPAKITLTAQGIEITGAPTAVATLGPSGIELASTPATFTVAASAIESAHGPTTVAVKPAGIEMASAPAEAKIAPSGIELKNGAASVALSPASVNINNGALEVI